MPARHARVLSASEWRARALECVVDAQAAARRNALDLRDRAVRSRGLPVLLAGPRRPALDALRGGRARLGPLGAGARSRRALRARPAAADSRGGVRDALALPGGSPGTVPLVQAPVVRDLRRGLRAPVPLR